MEGLLDTFGDLASFSLANDFVSNNNDNIVSEPFTFLSSLVQSEYINYIYIGLAMLGIIIGVLIYKFNYVKRKPETDNTNSNINSNLLMNPQYMQR